MPAKVALAPVRDNHAHHLLSPAPSAAPNIITGQAYAVLFVQRLGPFTPSTAALYAALAGLVSEQA